MINKQYYNIMQFVFQHSAALLLNRSALFTILIVKLGNLKSPALLILGKILNCLPQQLNF